MTKPRTNLTRHKPIIFIISSPSGCGKTTLTQALLKQDKRIERSISVTTRSKRRGEVNGRDYCFVTRKRFDEMIAKDMFIEYAEVFGNYYGTPKKQADQCLKAGLDVMCVIDWQGGLRLMRQVKKGAVSVFILPPSIKTLSTRLVNRGTDTPDVIKRRLALAQEEISKCKYYDYIVVNDKIENAVAQLKSILEAERLKRTRLDINKVVSNLKN